MSISESASRAVHPFICRWHNARCDWTHLAYTNNFCYHLASKLYAKLGVGRRLWVPAMILTTTHKSWSWTWPVRLIRAVVIWTLIPTRRTWCIYGLIDAASRRQQNIIIPISFNLSSLENYWPHSQLQHHHQISNRIDWSWWMEHGSTTSYRKWTRGTTFSKNTSTIGGVQRISNVRCFALQSRVTQRPYEHLPKES